ncbi:MAG: hypothetical protein K0U54_06910 [Bacteroidetes bacterium]|nr:hypothetical protein [Bacteroidota bacterium]
MLRGINNKKVTRVVLILAILLFISSIIVHQQRDFVLYRGLRGITCLSFLGLLLLFTGKKINTMLVGFMVLYSISSFLTIWYENNGLAIAAMITNFLAYLVLVIGLIPKVSLKKMNVVLLILFALLVGINGYLLYEFVLMIENFTLSNLHYSFILLGAMSLVVVGFLSLLYNYIHSSKASLIFTLSIFSIIFGEIFRAIGYYDFAYGDISVYMARTLLIIGLGLMLNYAIVEKQLPDAVRDR